MSHAELLEWYIESGVDEALDDTPRNHFLQPQPASAPHIREEAVAAIIASTIPPAASHPVPTSAAAQDARTLAESCHNLTSLKAAVMGFEGCALKKTAKNTVFSDGNPDSGLMLIGEAPGESEDIQGIPFCGASGQLLDDMLRAIGRDRTSSYITNTIFWRPPGNRTPSDEETALCRPFVEKHIAIVKPKLIVLVGGTATKSVLGDAQGITRLRGKFYSYTNQYIEQEIPVAILFHPSYLLRQPAQKRLAWQDLLQIKHFMQMHDTK